MFRLLRLALFTLAAFTAGVFHERNETRERCAAAGGTVTDAGFCRER